MSPNIQSHCERMMPTLMEPSKVPKYVPPHKRRQSSSDPELAEPPKKSSSDLKSVMTKYWPRRYSLFSRFDEGIKLDREMWYSVTPENLAKHHAKRMKCDVIVDGFCGAGGNAIQFAMTCRKVIAIDLDPAKIELAKHNAAIYGVAHKIQFLVGDFLTLAPFLRADMVFMSPPWGGPEYVSDKVFDLETRLLPVSIHRLLEAARSISPNVAAFVPKNSNTNVLIGERCEVERNFVGRWQSALTLYFGGLSKGPDSEVWVRGEGWQQHWGLRTDPRI